jgi:exodeoxyribonuclease VII large subunit
LPITISMHASTFSKKIRTVTEINREIQQLFEGQFHFVRITGEISTVRRPHSGHYYFNLKDQHSQIKAVLFKNQQRYLLKDLKEGQQVICDGRLSVYQPRGEYQIIIDTVDFHGAGQLQAAFEQLKEKLKLKGFFDRETKRTLPTFVKNIVLITSPSGAAVHDFLAICRHRNMSLNVQILPVPVQGEGSVELICDALKKAHALDPDVIVLCRGGGSIEDLWSFNDERLAQTIFAATIPVVTGIGHETDFTIADFCADVRGATPTAAAELIVPNGALYRDLVANLCGRIVRSCRYRFDTTFQRLNRVNRILATFDSAFSHPTLRLDNISLLFLNAITSRIDREVRTFSNLESRLINGAPSHQIRLHKVRLDHLLEKLNHSYRRELQLKQTGLQKAAAVLDSLSPLATLARGYSIVTSKKKIPATVVTDIDQVCVNDDITVRLHGGELDCIVSAKRK